MNVVHIAGEVQDNRQSCLRCGMVLIDYWGVSIASTSGVGPSFWKPGALIGIDGRYSYVIEGREMDDNEQTCKREKAVQ